MALLFGSFAAEIWVFRRNPTYGPSEFFNTIDYVDFYIRVIAVEFLDREATSVRDDVQTIDRDRKNRTTKSKENDSFFVKRALKTFRSIRRPSPFI